MIQIKSISKRYDAHLAVDHVSLDIKKGEIFGLLGPNGAGKTTLVNTLCGVLSPDKGEVLIDGYDIQKEPLLAKAKLGVVPQEIALFDAMTVSQNLKYFAALYGLKGEALKRGIQEALDFSQIHEKKNAKVKKLSGGMKRRLNIACAIMHHPEVLILDEPTVGIDPHSRNHILEATKSLNAHSGTTVVYITHYMEEVEKICDRIAIIDHGKLLIEGTQAFITDSVSDAYQIEIVCSALPEDKMRAFVAFDGIIEVTPTDTGITVSVNKKVSNFGKLAHWLTENGIEVSAMTLEKPSLEWAFLKLTGRHLRDKDGGSK